MGTRSPVLLGSYAAKRCARRVHNEWDRTIRVELDSVPAQLQARIEAGRAHEARVKDELTRVLGERCLLVGEGASRDEAIAVTMQGMQSGTDLIVGGWLPDDPAGGRTGRPDLLLRVNSPSVGPAYVPGDVKAHLTTRRSAAGKWPYSTLARPGIVEVEPGRAVRVADRLEDYLQIAHYARMLQACGRAPDEDAVRGFIIGTDHEPGRGEESLVLTWLDLQSPMFTTFSRSRGTAKRSALERYDHEHGFRVAIAETARQRAGSPSDPDPLVQPVITDECDVCPWHDYCRSVLGPEAASAILEVGRLDVREWKALADAGIETAQGLAGLEDDLDQVDGQWWHGYLPNVTHQPQARERLRLASRRARMALAGVGLERTTAGPIDVPQADVEIDFDIEWDATNRVFLWGALLTDDQNPQGTYVYFTELNPLDQANERALGKRFLEWLRNRIHRARLEDQTIAVFHYSHPETSQLKRVFGEREVADLLPRFVDLLPIVRANYIGVAGLSIKEVAPEFGFHWQDEDPGGLQAQAWLEDARAVEGVQRAAFLARLLRYNEDDVRATAALRHGLRQSR